MRSAAEKTAGPEDYPLAFVDGDLAYFYCAEAGSHVQPQGVRLVKAASVLGDRARWAAWQALQWSVGAATLHSDDAILLLSNTDTFMCVQDGTVGFVSSDPTEAQLLLAVRVDGGPAFLEVGATVELRLTSDIDGGTASGAPAQRCLQMRAGGRLGIALSGAANTTFVMQSDGAPEGSPHWANPRCIGFGRLPAHVPLRSYRSRAAALARDDPRLRLSGCPWDFRLFSRPAAVVADVATGGAAADNEGEEGTGWRPIPVPSNWQMHSTDPPVYTNVACVAPNANSKAPGFLSLFLSLSLSLSFFLPLSFSPSLSLILSLSLSLSLSLTLCCLPRVPQLPMEPLAPQCADGGQPDRMLSHQLHTALCLAGGGSDGR